MLAGGPGFDLSLLQVWVMHRYCIATTTNHIAVGATSLTPVPGLANQQGQLPVPLERRPCQVNVVASRLLLPIDGSPTHRYLYD